MIKISNITKKYNPKKSNEFEALHGVSCEINDGELVAVIGKSGAGKSTLLHILACIDNYQEGEYTIDGTLVKNLSEKQYAKIRNEKIGMVMQDFALVEDFTALENVMIPLNFSKQKIKNKKEKALAALKSVGNVSQKVLTAQLRAMEESGLLTRTVYAEVPPRVEYSLTELGKSLKPILDSMWAWGEDYKKQQELADA